MIHLSEFGFVATIVVLTIGLVVNTSAFPLWSKPVGIFKPKRSSGKTKDAPVVSLLVEIPTFPTSSVQYAKPLDVKTGGKFYLETPMEHYAYSSSGRSNLHRVKVVYLMQSMYRPNLMCFFLHFWSMKDPTVPWNVPKMRISPPPWVSRRLPK